MKNIRNFSIIAHIDHGKTTMTDNLIAAAGLMSEELAGKQRMMDYYQLEQDRGISDMLDKMDAMEDAGLDWSEIDAMSDEEFNEWTVESLGK